MSAMIERAPALFYVWVYVPSAVRTNYAVGVFSKGLNWRHQFELDDYNENHVALMIWGALPPINKPPTFYSADELDAPVSAGLCAALRALATTTEQPR